MGKYMDQLNLDGQIAVITGGAGGFGRVMAEALTEAGAAVALVGRHEDTLAKAADSISGGKVVTAVADVIDEEQVVAMAAEVKSKLGAPTILINNAGINMRKPMLEFTLEEWNKVVDTSLTGSFLCTRALGEDMVNNGYGRVINISSMLGFVGLEGRTAYTSAKGALLQFTRTLALEWAPDGVTVNAVCPGPFATEINTVVLENAKTKAEFESKIPLGRFGRPEELGGLILYLASPSSSFVTGSQFVIDGGWIAR
ncbi:SDR family NAD(P)-dependent oxidoreductase [Candidatus Hydrogenedentota bacterium]